MQAQLENLEARRTAELATRLQEEIGMLKTAMRVSQYDVTFGQH